MRHIKSVSCHIKQQLNLYYKNIFSRRPRYSIVGSAGENEDVFFIKLSESKAVGELKLTELAERVDVLANISCKQAAYLGEKLAISGVETNIFNKISISSSMVCKSGSMLICGLHRSRHSKKSQVIIENKVTGEKELMSTTQALINDNILDNLPPYHCLYLGFLNKANIRNKVLTIIETKHV